MNNQFYECTIDELHNCSEFIRYVESFGKDGTNEFAKVVSREGIYSTDKMFTHSSAWYLEDLKAIVEYLNGNDVDREKAYIIYFLVQLRFMENVEERYKMALTNAEYEKFLQLVKQILQEISIDIILDAKYSNDIYGKVLTRYLLELLEQTKYYSNLYEKETPILVIQCMNWMEKKNAVVIDVTIKDSVFTEISNIELYVKVGEQRLPVIRTNRYAAIKFFDQVYFEEYTGSIEIPLDENPSKIKMVFELVETDKSRILPLNFSSIHAKLYEKFEKGYWNRGDYTVSYGEKEQAILIEKRSHAKTLKKEINFWINCLKCGASFSRTLKSILLRICYFITLPYYKNRNVWITFDQLYKGGDNGEYFFKYVSSLHSKEETIYYIVKKDAAAYEKLRNHYKNVVAYNSFRHKLLSLHAKAIFATRTEVHLCCGYWDELEIYFRGLFNADIFCLQHGVTIQEIAKYQNRVYDNTKLYFCVSNKEIENLKQPAYDYKKESLLLTGSPRYDGLTNTKEKMIVISPTWRRSLVLCDNKKGELHSYNPSFKESNYYKVYQELLQNTELLRWATANDYRIVFLLHPIVSVQMKDFVYQKPVEIIAGSADTNYEEYLNRASILITDYSGIQFDFAYMKKPLIYFHPENLPAQYGTGGLAYETEAFGPICNSINELVKNIEIYEKDPKKWEKVYLNRIRDFFVFEDRNNCARIYQAVKEYQHS